MYLVGLTGGIGSGKSTVAARFAEHGWPVVDADGVAREIVAPGEPALAELASRFGDEVLSSDGGLDRPTLARVAFASPEGKAALDRITHPRIAARIAERVATLDAEHVADEPLVAVVDHPLLIETGQASRFDAVVVVLAAEDERVRRLVTERGLDEDDVRARLRAQTDDEARRAAATHVLTNDGGLDELVAAVDELVVRIEAAARAQEGGAW